MTVRLTRTSHGRPPQLLGIEIDDDGRAAGWQTSGQRVGRFARELSAKERKALDRALSAARDAGDDTAAPAAGQPRRPGGATEQLTADGLPDVVLTPPASPPKAYRKLVDLLRDLREDLADSPVGAIELEVTGAGARLRHVGPEPVAVRGRAVTVQVTSFGADSAVLDSATHTVEAAGVTGEVGDGWELPLLDDLGGKAPKGGFRTVTAEDLEVDALGDGVLRPARFSWMSE